MKTEVLKVFQVAPTAGIKIAFLCWQRLELGFNIQGIYAFKPYQRMYFTYSYKGEPKGTAIFEATGTGLFVSTGVGFRIVKHKG